MMEPVDFPKMLSDLGESPLAKRFRENAKDMVGYANREAPPGATHWRLRPLTEEAIRACKYELVIEYGFVSDMADWPFAHHHGWFELLRREEDEPCDP